jgi:hypothetical protein
MQGYVVRRFHVRQWLLSLVVLCVGTGAPVRAFDRVVALTEPVDSPASVSGLRVIDPEHFAQYVAFDGAAGALRFFGPDGRVTQAWEWQDASMYAPVLVGGAPEHVRALLHQRRRLHAYSASGALLWASPVPGEPASTASYYVAADHSGRTWLYRARADLSAELLIFGANGRLVRQLSVGKAVLTPAYGYPDLLAALDVDDGAMYYIDQSVEGGQTPRLMRMHVEGAPIVVRSDIARESSFMMTATMGGVLIAQAAQLELINRDGTTRWRRTLPGMGIVANVAFGADSSVAIVAGPPVPDFLPPTPTWQLFRLGSAGSILWQTQIQQPALCINIDYLNCALRVRADGGVWLQDISGPNFTTRLYRFGAEGVPVGVVSDEALRLTRDAGQFMDDNAVIATDATGAVRVASSGEWSRIIDHRQTGRPASALRDGVIARDGSAYFNVGLRGNVRERFSAMNSDGSVRWTRTFDVPSAISRNALHVRATDAGPVYLEVPGLGPFAVHRDSGATLSDNALAVSTNAGVVLPSGALAFLGVQSPSNSPWGGAFVAEPTGQSTQALRLFDSGELPLAIGMQGEFLTSGSAFGLRLFRGDGSLRYQRNVDDIDRATSNWGVRVGNSGDIVRRWSTSTAQGTRLYRSDGQVVLDVPTSSERGAGMEFNAHWAQFDDQGGAYVLDTREQSADVREVRILHLTALGTTREVARFPEPSQRVADAYTQGAMVFGTDLLREGDTLVAVSTRPGQIVTRAFDARTGARRNMQAHVGDSFCDGHCDWSIDAQGSLRGLAVLGDQLGQTQRAVAVRADNALTVAPSLRLDQPGIRGIWYDPAYSGQGLTLDYATNTRTLFAAWFIYKRDAENHPRAQRWLTLAGTLAPNTRAAELRIYANVGGNFDATPITHAVDVGSARLTLDDCLAGTLTWSFDATPAAENDWLEAGEMRITRLGPRPADCADGAGAGASYDARLTGSWYVPEISGQGINLYAVDGATRFIYGAWFTYDLAATTGAERAGQRWFTFQGGFDSAANGVAEGVIYETLGGRFALAATSNTRRVGTMRVISLACDRARFEWVFDDDASVGNLRGVTGARDFTRLGPCPS